MPILHRDFETRSTLDLKRVGGWRYAADASTAVWCVAYAIDGAPTELWLPGQPVPEVFTEAARNPDWLVGAHNDAFERLIERFILAPRFGWPLVPIERHRCTMAMALACALPAKLERVAEALSLPLGKDAEGARLMKRMARPRKPRRGEDPNGVYWLDDPDKLARLGQYCIRDVDVERDLYHRLPPLSDAEHALWVLDAAINARGFHTDGPLLQAASHIAEAADQALQAELAEITSGVLTSTNQTKALQDWLAEHGCEVSDIQKGTLSHALRRKGLDPAVRRVIELRREAAHAAANKIDTVRAWRNPDGRVRGTLQFHGAGPGRWTGRGPQPQNFKRDSDDLDGKIAAVATGDLAQVAARYSPLQAVGDIARAMICAAPGHRFLIGDFSGVESRVTAWVTGQQSKLDQWAAFDVSNDPLSEPYYLIGRALGLPEESAREKGKIADLAFGYQGGPGAWDNFASEDDVSTTEQKQQYKRKWRGMHPHTVAFWREIDRAALMAVRNPGRSFTVNRLQVVYDGSSFLTITLPSGRALRYPFPTIKPGKYEDPVVIFKDNSGGKWTDCNHGFGGYGGLWTENIVQAISRDLLAAALQRLEQHGYATVLHVHDEVIAEVPLGVGTLDEFRRLLTAVPEWADGLPLAAKVREGERFSKPDKPKPPVESISASTAEPDADEVSEPVAEPKTMSEPETGDKASTGLEGSAMPSSTPVIPISLEQIERMFQTANPSEPDEPAEEPHSSGQHRGGNGAANGHDADDDTDDDGNDPSGYPHGERRRGRQIAVYLYQDLKGRNHTKIEKLAPRGGGRAQYPQSFWIDGKWVQSKPKLWRKIPYRLPELLAAPPGTDVFIPEGEKDAESLRSLGLIATTSSEGATPLKAKESKWTPELNRWFEGVQRVFIPEDNDDVGRKFAREKAQALAAMVADIRIVSFPDVPEGEDVSWWLQHGHSKEELLARCEAAPKASPATLQSVRASQVPMRAVQWLWQDRFALGKLGIFAGLPDEGKSMLSFYVSARITRPEQHKWPNGEGQAPQGNVILLTAEDDPEDTVVPRLVAAGADLDRVEIVSMVRDRDQGGLECERMFSLGDDLELLRQKIDQVGDVRAILIDPVTAYLGRAGAVDSYRDSDVRAVLTPLVHLAYERRIAVIVIMHFNKKVDVTNALLRISNSLAFGGVARHVFSVTDDEENGRKLLARAKNNIAAKSDNQTLAFHFDTREVGNDPETGEVIRAPLVVFEPGYVDVTATEALSAVNENKAPAGRDRAKQFVLDFLRDGQAVLATEMKAAAEANGISWRTINRAKEQLLDKGIIITVAKDNSTPDGPWFWKLET